MCHITRSFWVSASNRDNWIIVFYNATPSLRRRCCGFHLVCHEVLDFFALSVRFENNNDMAQTRVAINFVCHKYGDAVVK